MKTIRSLVEIRTRLDDALAALPGELETPADIWDAYEMLCIAELDSSHDQFTAGILEEFLMTLLNLKMLELGLLPDFEE